MGNKAISDFTNDLGFTVLFLIGALIINLTFGSKVLYGYLVLVLLSMSVMNYNKISYYLGKVAK